MHKALQVFRFVTHGGSTPFYGLLILLTLRLPELSARLAAGLLLVFAVAVPCKLLFYRDRPRKQPYHNLFEKVDAGSFPSVHAMRATMLALLFTWRFHHVWVGCIGALFVSLVAYSRIYLRKHTMVDVVAGIAFSVLLFGLLMFF